MTLVICLAAGAVATLASTVVPMSLREVAGQAHRVVVGRIERIDSSRDAATGRIVSRVEISETRNLAGEPLGRLSFEMTGGTAGDLRQWIAGFPVLNVGDELVLFLAESTSTPLGPTVGLWQGVFFVERDASGDRTVVDHLRRPIAEIREGEIVRGSAPRPGTVAQSAGPRVSLDSFLGQVRSFRAPARAAAGAR